MSKSTEGSRETYASSQPEQDTSPIDLSSLFDEQRSVHENPDVREAAAIIEGTLIGESGDSEQLRRAWVEYAKIMEAIADSMKDPLVRSKTQVAAGIHKALIFKTASKTLRYLEELGRPKFPGPTPTQFIALVE